MSRNTKILLSAFIAVLLMCCCLTIAAVGATIYFFDQRSPALLPSPDVLPELLPTRPVRTPTPPKRATPESSPTEPGETSAPDEPVGTPTATLPPPDGVLDTETALREVEVPPNDARDLASRLKPELGEIPLVVNDVAPEYNVGDVKKFWVSNTDTDENFQVEAELKVKSEHLYMWVEKGVRVRVRDLERSAKLFDEKIYPTNREFFGSEWSPGVDNDPRLHILHAKGMGDTVAGYYSSADEISSKVNPFSNEKEMFYINLSNNPPGTDFYDSTLAHEFQHMIHWYNDQNESTWINEGASELATQLNDLFRTGDSFRPDQAFAVEPDLQLNTWPDSEKSYAHYGNAFLFLNYFLSRFGEDMTKALVANHLNGLESVDAILAANNQGTTADEVFADWVIANWLDKPDLMDGRWGYPDFDPDTLATTEEHSQLPAAGQGDVHQYAADYIPLSAEGDVEVTFDGSTQTRLAATDAHSGRYAWWTNRVDESDTRLTLPVDLTGVTSATLRYQLWYDIEEFWDYGYIEVSADGGKTWKIQETDRTTTENPQGNAYGPGYTGKSGGNDTAEWVQEEIDLSPYAGQPIQIRFEYVTDAAVTMPGMFIDDVEIPEIDYATDFEQGPGPWQSEGFLLTNNTLNQHWIVQVIQTAEDGQVQVHRLPVGSDGKGVLKLENVSGGKDNLILVISALAPETEEIGSYSYSVH